MLIRDGTYSIVSRSMSTSSPVIKGIFFRLFLKCVEPSVTQLVKPKSGHISHVTRAYHDGFQRDIDKYIKLHVLLMCITSQASFTRARGCIFTYSGSA